MEVVGKVLPSLRRSLNCRGRRRTCASAIGAISSLAEGPERLPDVRPPYGRAAALRPLPCPRVRPALLAGARRPVGGHRRPGRLRWRRRRLLRGEVRAADAADPGDSGAAPARGSSKADANSTRRRRPRRPRRLPAAPAPAASSGGTTSHAVGERHAGTGTGGTGTGRRHRAPGAPAARPSRAGPAAADTGGATADQGFDQFCADNPGACDGGQKARPGAPVSAADGVAERAAPPLGLRPGGDDDRRHRRRAPGGGTRALVGVDQVHLIEVSQDAAVGHARVAVYDAAACTRTRTDGARRAPVRHDARRRHGRVAPRPRRARVGHPARRLHPPLRRAQRAVRPARMGRRRPLGRRADPHAAARRSTTRRSSLRA